MVKTQYFIKSSLIICVGISSWSYIFCQDSDTQKKESLGFHAQATVITQYKPAFNAKYSGANSLIPQMENQNTITATLYAGSRLWKGASIYINSEISGGSGLSKASGVAASTNGESFRVGDPEPKLYLARLFFQQVLPLGSVSKYVETDANRLAGKTPLKYIRFTIGKICMTDYFDNNAYSHDPRTQFLSWALMANGAWDYPANTRGYTDAFVVEYISPKNEVRYSFALVPTEANGNSLDYNISKANSNTLEYTRNYMLHSRPGSFRVLAFYTIARMGNYNESLKLITGIPDIISTRKYSNNKYGLGINADQSIFENTGIFFKSSINDGQNETWAFTEIDHTVSGGIVVKGTKWKRPNDQVGGAYVISGISIPHRNYLQAGGYGFMLGDGNLNYGLENLLEIYYSAQLIKNNLFLSGAYQFIVHPGYNKDRGPVNVFSVRVHIEI